MAIVAVIGGKGGVGKTTAALCLATEWHRRGLRVLLVDSDTQGTCRTFSAVAAEAGHPCPTVVGMGVGLHLPGQLPALAAGYDRVIVDTPPRQGDVTRSALMAADLAILPCGPSAADTWALATGLDLVAAARAVRPGLGAAVLLTRRVPRTALGEAARSTLEACGLPLLRAELQARIVYAEAPAAGLGPTVYAPRSPAAAEVRALAAEVDALLEALPHGDR